MEKDSLYAVLMAGGRGERLWPYSRKRNPKQFLRLGTSCSLIQETYRRVRQLVPPDKILVVTNSEQAKLVARHLPELPRKNILIEPRGRNTAACLGLAGVHIQEKEKDAVILGLPSDHIIKGDAVFRGNILTAVKFARKGNYLVTLGIKPTNPACGYGYIKIGRRFSANGIFKVDKFVEKPDLKTAQRYLESGRYLWNSGMFIFKVSSLLSAFKKYMPKVYMGLQKIKENITVSKKKDYFKILSIVYQRLPNISIDYGVMEKDDNVYCVQAEFVWDDVGSWEALSRILKKDEQGNVSMGKVFSIDTKNSILASNPKHLLATLGVSDMIVVHTPYATLVCPRTHADRIKTLSAKMR